MLLGLIRGLETLCDTIEYGPVRAFQINTSACPEAERSYHHVMSNINNCGCGSSIEEEDPILTAIGKEFFGSRTQNTKKEKPASKPTAYITTSKPVNAKVEAEIVVDKVSIGSVTKNIAAAIHEFSIDNDEDKQLLKCFILAFYRYNDRIDKDVLNKMLKTDEDKTLYIAILRWFDSAAMGSVSHVGNTIIDKSIVMELKKFLEWELIYIKDLSTAAQAASIKNGFKDILENLKDLKQDVIINPIVSVPEGNPVPKSGFTDEEKKSIMAKLKADFADILKDHEENGLMTYKFNMLAEIAELLVMDKEYLNAPAKYRIDPGVIIGNGINLIYYAMGQDGVMRDIYINVAKRPDIVKNVVDKPGYTLTQQEIQQALADSFTNKLIYYYIDMSSFSKHLNLDAGKMDKLENNLSAVTNVLNTENGIPAARLRLNKWNSVDNFTLISDKDCRSPFAMQGSTCRDIIAGMNISVVKDDITVKYKDPATGKMLESKFVIKR